MKRLVLFISIFGAGLLILMLALGPGHLYRRSVRPTIAPEDLPPAPNSVSLPSQGSRINVGMSGRGTIPFWVARTDAKGTRRYKIAQLRYEGNEPFAGGTHLLRPVVERFPGEKEGEQPTATIRAASGDLATRGDLQSLAENEQPLQKIRAATFGPDVVIERAAGDGFPAFEIETARVELPETESALGDEPLFPRIVGPQPVRIHAADGSFDARAASFELRRLDGHFILNGPLAVTATQAGEPPLTLTCDGTATFSQKREAGAKPAAAGAADLESGVGPGTLRFEKNVLVRQPDPNGGPERSLRAELVELDLQRDEKSGRMVATGLRIGGPDGVVALKLLGGEGSARHLARDEAGGDLVFSGPVHLDDLHVGTGTNARTIALKADERLVLHTVEGVGKTPTRHDARLVGAAQVTSAGELDARADELTAALLDRGGDGGVDVESLDLEGHAPVELGARGRAHAGRITLREGGRKAHLEGDAVVETPQGTLRGPVLDLDVPTEKGAPIVVTVPVLTGGDREIPPDVSLFDAPARGGGASAARPAGRKRRLRLEPIGTPRLEVAGEAVHLRGRTRVRVVELEDEGRERDLQVVIADSIDLVPQPGGKPELVADGDVDATDFEQGAHLTAAHAHTESSPDGHRHLKLEGAPAIGRTPFRTARDRAPEELELRAARLDYDLTDRRIVADDPIQRVKVVAPEALVGFALPAGIGAAARAVPPRADAAAPAAAPPLVFAADHVEVVPQDVESVPEAVAKLLPQRPDSPFARALVTARGRVHATRESDGSTFDALRLELDLARARARIEGSEDEPVVLRRPKPYEAARVDEMRTAWLEADVTDAGRRRIRLAPRSKEPVFRLYPDRLSEDGAQVLAHRRVELRCTEAPELIDDRLVVRGGVDTDLVLGDDRPEAEQAKAHARSERVDLQLSAPAGDPKAAPLRLSAQERVRLDFHSAEKSLHAEGALLSFDFPTGELVMKEGIERCQLLSLDPQGDWRAVANFSRLSLGPLDAALDPARARARPLLFSIKGLAFVAKGPLER